MTDLAKRVKKINQQIASLMEENTQHKANLHFLDQQSLITEANLRQIMSKKDKQRNYIGKDGKALFEFDEVMNNVKQINEEYDITSDETTGKVWIASTNGEVIIQGVIAGYVPKDSEKPAPGAEFIYLEGKPNREPKEGEYHDAMFSGAIHFENLPLKTFATLVKGKEEVKDEKLDKQKETTSSDIRADFIPALPTKGELSKISAGQLKPPKCSRTAKANWWKLLREKYPDSFDHGGNWLGLVDSKPNMSPNFVDGRTLDIDNKKDVQELVIEEEGKAVSEPVKPANDRGRGVPGLLTSTGQGNAITNMTDDKIKNGFFLGRLFEKGYAIISTPAKEGDFEKSAFLICNKEKTAKFLNIGLNRSQSFVTKVDGAEPFHIRELKKEFFEDTPENKKVLVWWITNAVSALQALGTQDKDIESIKEQISA